MTDRLTRATRTLRISLLRYSSSRSCRFRRAHRRSIHDTNGERVLSRSTAHTAQHPPPRGRSRRVRSTRAPLLDRTRRRRVTSRRRTVVPVVIAYVVAILVGSPCRHSQSCCTSPSQCSSSCRSGTFETCCSSAHSCRSRARRFLYRRRQVPDRRREPPRRSVRVLASYASVFAGSMNAPMIQSSGKNSEEEHPPCPFRSVLRPSQTKRTIQIRAPGNRVPTTCGPPILSRATPCSATLSCFGRRRRRGRTPAAQRTYLPLCVPSSLNGTPTPRRSPPAPPRPCRSGPRS